MHRVLKSWSASQTGSIPSIQMARSVPGTRKCIHIEEVKSHKVFSIRPEAEQAAD